MRVLHVAPGNLFGGIEVMLLTLARHADAAPGLSQHFAMSFEGPLHRQLSGLGASVRLLGPARGSRPLSVLRARRALRQAIRELAVEVVICHGTWAHALFASAARREGRTLAFFLHGAVEGRHWLERWAARTPPDLALVNSRFTGTTLPAIFPGARPVPVYCPVAPPAVDSAAARSAVRAELGAGPATAAIVQVSRMEGIKGHAVHLDALARLAPELDWVCWLVGGAQRAEEERYRDHLREQATRLGLGDRVRFLGQRSDVSQLLAAADVYCQPNVGPEGFGITFVEAQYAGLPVVTSDVGSAPEIVDASCGVLVPAGDAGAVAAALEGLLRDAALRARLGAAGAARARERFAPARQIARLQEALAGAASGAAPARRGAGEAGASAARIVH